jgi:GTP-binding protein
VDTGGVVPDDEALIPAEIFRQAQVALEEADSIIMVVDGRTELASPDLELARLLLRGGKPVFLAVNKMDTDSMNAGAENFRRLGFRNVLPISAEHGSGIGDLLDEVFDSLPEEVENEPDAVMLTATDEMEEDENGPDFSPTVIPAVPASGLERKLRSHGEHVSKETKVAIIGRPNVGKSTLLNALTGTQRAIVSPIAGTTRDAVDEVVERGGHSFRFVDTAGIRRKGKTKLMAEKLSVIMARKHLEAADVSLLIIDAAEGVAALDANIGGYAHESGRSVIIVVNKWDLMTKVGPDGMRLFDGKPPADQKQYEQDVRDKLKYLEYAPLVFISAADGKNIDGVFKKVELVARERRKRVTTGQMNKFLEKVDFQKASVPMNKRVRIYYMTQAAVAPPTFVLFTDKDVKLHFGFERFLANQIREHFGFIGSPIWFKVKARNKKKQE